MNDYILWLETKLDEQNRMKVEYHNRMMEMLDYVRQLDISNKEYEGLLKIAFPE